VFVTCTLLCGLWCSDAIAELTSEQSLGKRLFFDASLSTPPGQGCLSCHSPAAGFADPDRDRPVSA
jgi:cytochrome c peroxidase